MNKTIVKDKHLGLGVSGIVIYKNKLLLIKRKDLKDWALPGGVVEEGETLEQAVQREVFEETGIKVKPEKLSGIYVRTKWKNNLLFTFRCRKIEGKRKTSSESLDVVWVSLRKVNRMLNKNLQIRVEDGLDTQNQVFLRKQNEAELKLIWLWKKRDLQKFLKNLFK